MWTLGTTVLPAEWELLDEHQANAIDGVDGGAYSLQDDLIIGGAPGVEVRWYLKTEFGDDVFIGADPSTLVYVNSVAHFVSPATFDDTVIHNDGVTCNGNVGMLGSVLLGSSTADSILVLGDFTVVPDAAFSGDVTVAGGVFVNGASEFLDTLTAYGAVALEGTVVTNGAGNLRVRRVRRQTLGADANASIDVTLTDHVAVLPGGITATRIYTINDTGAVNGDRVRFSNQDTSFAVIVQDPSALTLQALLNAAGSSKWCDVERINGAWRSFPGDRA